jgi:hypothetical protein
MIPGAHPRRSLGHMDTAWLEAEAARLGKTLHPRAIPATATEPGRLVLVLDIGVDKEFTADYWGAA